jgi:hypothetical protein
MSGHGVVRRRASGRAAVVALLVGAAPLGAQDVQFGLRLDSRSSLQWDGSALYTEGSRRAVTRTTAGRIREVWPGPRRGLFAVHTDRGLGLMLGRDAQILGIPQPPGVILRSSRPEAFWAGYTLGRTSHVREWWASGHGRELLRIDGRLVDFDVSADGVVAVLLEPDAVWLAGESPRPRPVPRPPALRSAAIRVFLTKDHAELALLARGQLCRAPTAGPWRWWCEGYDPARHAIVRHVWNGRPAVEARFGAPPER